MSTISKLRDSSPESMVEAINALVDQANARAMDTVGAGMQMVTTASGAKVFSATPNTADQFFWGWVWGVPVDVVHVGSVYIRQYNYVPVTWAGIDFYEEVQSPAVGEMWPGWKVTGEAGTVYAVQPINADTGPYVGDLNGALSALYDSVVVPIQKMDNGDLLIPWFMPMINPDWH